MSENQDLHNQNVDQEQPKETNNNILNLMDEDGNANEGVKHASDVNKMEDDDSDNLKIDLGYADEEDGQESPDEVYKQYVRKKLLEVNKEFEKEPNDENQASDKERQKTIKFSNQVVEVAPCNYSETDEDNEDAGTSEDPNSKGQSEDKVSLKKDEPSKNGETIHQDRENEQKSLNEDSQTSKAPDQDESILVERDGTYKLVNKSELEAEAKANKDQTKPKPPNEPRPKSAKSSRPRSTPGRIQSTNKVDISHYVSPYALSDTQKKEGERQKKEREKQDRDRKEKEGKEKQEREREQEEHFHCWLRKSLQKQREEEKQREEKQKKEADESEKKNKKRDPISFPNWLDTKRQQKEKEEVSEKERQKEEQEHAKAFAVSKKECEKAFKRWKKRKITEEKRKQQEVSTKNKTNKLLSRRTRNKALLLSYAVRQQSAFKYVDYYGYRY